VDTASPVPGELRCAASVRIGTRVGAPWWLAGWLAGCRDIVITVVFICGMPQEIAPEFYRDLHGRNDILGVIREWGASCHPNARGVVAFGWVRTVFELVCHCNCTLPTHTISSRVLSTLTFVHNVLGQW
jgi:hypothetical protein